MRVGFVATAVCLSAIGVAVASDAEAAMRKSTHIAAQGLGPALQTLANEREFQIVYLSDAIDTLRTNGAVGELTADEALTKLLEGTGFSYRYLGERAVTIVPLSAASGDGATIGSLGTQSPPATRGERTPGAAAGRKSFWQRLRLAQADSSSEEKEAFENSSESAQQRIELEEILVTGTRVKGVQDQFSPVISISRDAMDLAGYDNVSDVFETLPQNFGGGATLDTTPAGSDFGSGGASINLRGLGNEATLILLNGRRLAPGGEAGSFIDISAIPTAAVERIEVMTDGASAIYGSDAIAGVVNIILRKDFTGAESRLNVGTITDGGGDTLKVGQTFGVGGKRAHGLVTYEYSSEDELNQNDKDFARGKRPDPNDLLPTSDKHSVFVSGGVQPWEGLRVSADGYYNTRKTEGFTSSSVFSTLTQNFEAVEVEQGGGALGVNWQVFGTWETDLSVAYSNSDHGGNTIRPNGSGNIDQADTDIFSVDASLGGPLFHTTSEPVRGVIGVHSRSEDAHLVIVNRLTGAFTLNFEREREVSAAYAEIYAPLIAAADDILGFDRLALSLAARYEEYSDVGSSFDPKVGLSWSPAPGLSIKGTYGTSFRAPRLNQLRDLYNVLLGIYADPEAPTGESVAILLPGITSDLGPEQAESWTVGFDLAPEQLPGLQLRATYFDIDYTDRIGPASFVFDTSNRFANFTGLPLRNPSLADVQNLAAGANIFSDRSSLFPSRGQLSLQDVTVLLDVRTQNLAASKVTGIDLEASFEMASRFGAWNLSLASTLLTSADQQVTPVTPPADLLGTFANPVDLRIRGGVTWTTARVVAALFVNYTDDYIDDEAAAGAVPIHSWTTVDAALRFDLGELFGGKLAQGAHLSLSVSNILNEDPPPLGIQSNRAAIYDASNADPAGRRLALLVGKRW